MLGVCHAYVSVSGDGTYASATSRSNVRINSLPVMLVGTFWAYDDKFCYIGSPFLKIAGTPVVRRYNRLSDDDIALTGSFNVKTSG